ncbi:hypothetical protein QLX67_13445, partial [Balneolaceae bacterium ANBcel3]|nr:hypothetical protein [Balneolaceae bacterium ANBcel3]
MKGMLTGLFVGIILFVSGTIQAQDIVIDYGGPYEGMPGDTIWFEVSLSDVSGLQIGNFNFTVQFDGELFEDLETADIFDGPVVPTTTVKNARTTEEVRLAWASTSQFLQGSGVLFSVRAVLSDVGYNENGIRIERYVLGTDAQGFDIEPPFPYSIPVHVYDSEPAEIDVDTSLLDFEDVIIGQTASLSFTISNPGVSDLAIISLTNANSAFSVDDIADAVISPSGEVEVEV